MNTPPTYTVQEIAEIIAALESMVPECAFTVDETKQKMAVRRAVAILKALRVSP